ncbi:MAG: acyl-ACP--UDP-N-acetylglucosamine O-acyltransferase [Leptospira sp.]|nr:acyl-ACP--UDP-N-acetylglucosamine O-acyltransferase [Leptospira sp.]
MKIHPTAIVDPGAELHESVEIGPYTIIEKNVRIGEGTTIESCIRIHSGTKIGKFNKIYHAASMGGLPQDISFNPDTVTHLEIGDSNVIREGCLFHRGTKEGKATIIGNNNYFMGNVHVGHDSKIGNHNIVVQAAAFAGHVTIGNRAFISGMSVTHQFVRIGDNVMVGGLTKIVKDVPPYSMIDGNPAEIIGLNSVGLKRAGFKPEIRDEIKKAYKIIYHSGLNTKQALEELHKLKNPSDEVKNIIQFFDDSHRGVTDHRDIRKQGSSE